MYKFGSGSGGFTCSGWINILFLYVNDYQGKLQKNYSASEVWDDKSGPGFGSKPNAFPKAMSITPFVWEYFAQRFDMKFSGGIIGAEQERSTGALKPVFTWIVLDSNVRDFCKVV